MDKRLHPPLPQEGFTKNYRNITLTAKVYNALFSIVKLRQFLGKIRTGLKKKSQSTTSDSEYPSNHWNSTCKKSQCNTIVHKFLQDIWFHTHKMEQILLAYGLSKETVKAMILHRNTKPKRFTPDKKRLQHC